MPRSSRTAARPAHTETKPSFKTTEFFVFMAAVVAVLVASAVVGSGNGIVDRFPADRAWLYVTLLSIGYLLSRGLAKSGSREPADHA
ncbi:hypothetical protein [Streptomyces ochraceiscleroticus]|uniref:Uncharacterized protein n=1 Tax=Streptomyces ochraceiscleroticus TaxID=47761 RepID=A0ABW1MKJ1_9ACTN|nr:hypothetical protein [Streptomyces ochraceiscleroticus]